MSSSEPETFDPLGVCRSFDDLRHILRTRFAELGISLETADHISGLGTRGTARILGLQPTRGFGAVSLDALLGAAAVMLIAVPDPEQLERIRNRLQPLERIDSSPGHKRVVIYKMTTQFLREIGRKGGLKSAAIAKRRKERSEIYRRNGRRRAELAAQRKTEGGLSKAPRR